MASSKKKSRSRSGGDSDGARLQKVLAEAGVASRRASEQIIAEGRVRVNGKKVTQMGVRVDPENDEIEVDGTPIRRKPRRYVAINKPRGVLCTQSDEKGRAIVSDLLPPEWDGMYPVGRLDRDTEGLIFMTDDGDFCLRVTHPRYQVRKRYRVELRGRILPKNVRAMKEGIVDEGEFLRASEIKVLVSETTGSLIELVLTEGKNREARRLLASQDLKIHLLRRIQIGPIVLGDLKVGRWRTLNPGEVGSFKRE